MSAIETRPDLGEALAEDLRTALPDDGSEGFSEPLRPRFTVHDLHSAAWAVEKYADHDREVAALTALARQKTQEIEAWLDQVTRTHRRAQAYLSSLLESYLRETGKKSLSLPEGEIKLRKLPARFDRDEKVISDWCREAGLTDYLKPAEVAWSRLKDACEVKGDGIFTSDGERVPGVTVSEQGDRFAVELG